MVTGHRVTSCAGCTLCPARCFIHSICRSAWHGKALSKYLLLEYSEQLCHWPDPAPSPPALWRSRNSHCGEQKTERTVHKGISKPGMISFHSVCFKDPSNVTHQALTAEQRAFSFSPHSLFTKGSVMKPGGLGRRLARIPSDPIISVTLQGK